MKSMFLDSSAGTLGAVTFSVVVTVVFSFVVVVFLVVIVADAAVVVFEGVVWFFTPSAWPSSDFIFSNMFFVLTLFTFTMSFTEIFADTFSSTDLTLFSKPSKVVKNTVQAISIQEIMIVSKLEKYLFKLLTSRSFGKHIE